MTGPPPALRGLRWLTAVVAVVAFAWVLRPLVADLGGALERLRPLRVLVAWLTCTALYALLYIPVTEAWRRLLALHGPLPPWRPSWWVYGVTQWAKYLPSNVMHLMGRQVLGRRLGCSQAAIAVASILEMLSLLAAATWLTLALARFGVVWRPPVPWPVLAGLLAGALALWPIVLGRMRYAPGVRRVAAALPEVSWRDNVRALLIAQPLHLLYFAGVTVIFPILHRLALAPDPGSATGEGLFALAPVLWVVPAAWLAGVITPGAPGGIGVREAVLTLGLTQVMAPADASALALIYRLVTLSGDGLVALSASGLASTGAADPNASADP